MRYFETIGRITLGLGALGMGVISLIYGDFAITWQPVPDWAPARTALAYASGASLAISGAAMILNRFTNIAAAFIALTMCFWGLVLQPPRLFAGEEAAWLGPAEILAVAAAAWTLYWLRAAESGFRETAIRLGAQFFGLMLFSFGIAHFLYIDFTAQMIPAWISWRTFWAWFTGVGHVAAGFSIVLGVLPRIGSALLALMFTGFVLLVHVPRIAADIDNRVEWHLLTTALLLAGAAWIVASVFARKHELAT